MSTQSKESLTLEDVAPISPSAVTLLLSVQLQKGDLLESGIVASTAPLRLLQFEPLALASAHEKPDSTPPASREPQQPAGKK